MATAAEYAQWIVANKDKKGTPEFETVAKAYELARGQTAPAQAASQADVRKAETPQPTLFDRVLERFKGNMMLTPHGQAFQVAKTGMEQYDKLAYEAGGTVTDVTGSPELGGAANVAINAVPAFLGGGAGRSSARLAEQAGNPTALEQGAKKVMHSALKP